MRSKHFINIHVMQFDQMVMMVECVWCISEFGTCSLRTLMFRFDLAVLAESSGAC